MIEILMREFIGLLKNNFDKTPLISELSDTGVKSDKLMEFNSMFKNINEAQKDFYANGNELSDNDLFTKTDNVFFRSLLHGFTGNKYNSLNDLLKKKESVFYMPSGTCLAFYKKFFLTVNGKVLPCEKIGQKHLLGYVDDNKVDIDLDNISALYDKMYVPLLKLCKECYRQGNCSQCVFHIYDNNKSDKLYCPTFFNKKNMAIFLSRNISYIEENPDIYEEMIKKDLLS